MKAIIPVKASSQRVPDKNFKEFHEGQSLFDLTTAKLLKHLRPEDIYMSCESAEKESLAKKWGINFILRDPILADNDAPFYDLFNGVCDQVKGDDDIAWCQVIDPMFDSYKECFDIWNDGIQTFSRGSVPIREHHDSLVVIYPHKDYYLDSSFQPEGFGFGRWHIKSQLLPIKYQLTFTLSILTRESIKKCGYHVGSDPYWYRANTPRVDIDTHQDFDTARAMYAYLKGKKYTDSGSPCCI